MNRRNRRIRAVVRYRKPTFLLLNVQEYHDGQRVNTRYITLVSIDGKWYDTDNPHQYSAGAIRTSNYNAL